MTGNNYYILGNLAKEEYKDYRRIDGYLHPYKMCIFPFLPTDINYFVLSYVIKMDRISVYSPCKRIEEVHVEWKHKVRLATEVK